MRILIVSDTHGAHENLETVIQKDGPFDRMFHLGDSEVSLEELEELAGCMVDAVAGNMDFRSTLPREKVVEVEGYRILLTHGHNDSVDQTLLMLDYKAQNLDVDIAMFGHTHVALLEEEGIVLFNPGSLSRPRPWKALPSYGILEIDQDGEYQLTHGYLD